MHPRMPHQNLPAKAVKGVVPNRGTEPCANRPQTLAPGERSPQTTAVCRERWPRVQHGAVARRTGRKGSLDQTPTAIPAMGSATPVRSCCRRRPIMALQVIRGKESTPRCAPARIQHMGSTGTSRNTSALRQGRLFSLDSANSTTAASNSAGAMSSNICRLHLV